MTTGYQQPRRPQHGPQSRRGPQRLQGIGERGAKGAAARGSLRAGNALVDPAEADLADSYELPGGELLLDEHAVEILAEQLDEFTCGSCFLVRHRSQLARELNGVKYCRDCEG